MAYFGVGPAVDGTNTGKNTKQNSKMLPGGKVVDKNGRVIFDPSVSLTDLLPDSPSEGGLPLSATFTALQQLEISFEGALSTLPKGYYEVISAEDNTFRLFGSYVTVILIPGENVEFDLEGFATDLLSFRPPTGMPDGTILAEDILSGDSDPDRELDPYLLTLGGRNNTTFSVDGSFVYYSDEGSNAWFNAPETTGASQANGGAFTLYAVTVTSAREKLTAGGNETSDVQVFKTFGPTTVFWPPISIN